MHTSHPSSEVAGAESTAAAPADHDALQQLIDRWLNSVPNEHTRRGYRYAHTAWRTWLQAQGVELLEAQPEHVNTWRASLTGATATNAFKASAVSSFYAHALSEGAAHTNPVTRLVRPKANHPAPPEGLTVIQARYLLGHAQQYSPRAHALITLVLYTGIPVSDALRARVKDLELCPGAVLLHLSSTSDARVRVTLNGPVCAALEAYLGHPLRELAEIAGADKRSTPLFTTATGRSWDPNDAYRTIRRVIAAAGLPEKVNPYDLRSAHTALSRL